MFNALISLALLTHFLRCLFFDFAWIKFYVLFTFLYLVFVLWKRPGRENPKRKTLMLASWNGKFLA